MISHGTVYTDNKGITCIDNGGDDLIICGHGDGSISFLYLNSNHSLTHRYHLESLLDIIPESNADDSLRSPVTCVRVSPCLRFLAVGTSEGTVTILDMRSNDNTLYYICDEKIHKDRKFIGILSKRKNNLPCCFIKNQLKSKNKVINEEFKRSLFPDRKSVV